LPSVGAILRRSRAGLSAAEIGEELFEVGLLVVAESA
jgi:hypothetical protein